VLILAMPRAVSCDAVDFARIAIEATECFRDIETAHHGRTEHPLEGFSWTWRVPGDSTKGIYLHVRPDPPFPWSTSIFTVHGHFVPRHGAAWNKDAVRAALQEGIRNLEI
jgi:hypothetical protein